jgi:hypothetical protein
MNLKVKSNEAETSSSYSLCYRSEPTLSLDFSQSNQSKLKLKLKYRE